MLVDFWNSCIYLALEHISVLLRKTFVWMAYSQSQKLIWQQHLNSVYGSEIVSMVSCGWVTYPVAQGQHACK